MPTLHYSLFTLHFRPHVGVTPGCFGEPPLVSCGQLGARHAATRRRSGDARVLWPVFSMAGSKSATIASWLSGVGCAAGPSLLGASVLDVVRPPGLEPRNLRIKNPMLYR